MRITAQEELLMQLQRNVFEPMFDDIPNGKDESDGIDYNQSVPKWFKRPKINDYCQCEEKPLVRFKAKEYGNSAMFSFRTVTTLER